MKMDFNLLKAEMKRTKMIISITEEAIEEEEDTEVEEDREVVDLKEEKEEEVEEKEITEEEVKVEVIEEEEMSITSSIEEEAKWELMNKQCLTKERTMMTLQQLQNELRNS